MLDLPAEVLGKYDMSALKVIFAAGSAIPPDVVTRSLDYFGDSLYNVYGSTECAVITVATPPELRRAPNTAGKSPVGIRVALYDDQRKRITAPNVTGTIFIENPHSFKAYTDGRTKETVDGMMSSGDVGHFDETGLLFIDGRDDDIVDGDAEDVADLTHLRQTRPRDGIPALPADRPVQRCSLRGRYGRVHHRHQCPRRGRHPSGRRDRQRQDRRDHDRTTNRQRCHRCSLRRDGGEQRLESFQELSTII